MQFGLLSDLHLRISTPGSRKDNFFESQLAKMHFVMVTAQKLGIKYILQAGDMFDSAHPGNEVLSTYINLARTYDIRFLSVLGQHDMYFRSMQKSATSVMISAGVCTLLGDTPIDFDEHTHVYGASWNAPVPEPTTDGYNILVIHAPIYEKGVWAYHDYMDAELFGLEHEKYDLILCGDCHSPFAIKADTTLVLNTGCLVRLNRTEAKNEPYFYTVDTATGKFSRKRIPIEPVDAVFREDPLAVAEQDSSLPVGISALVEELRNGKGIKSNFAHNLNRIFTERQVPADVQAYISQEYQACQM